MSARARREIEQLYRGHRDAVYRSVLRDVRDPDEAEDVTQSAFLQAYGSVLRGRRPERPLAWLLAIADNLRRRRFVRARGKPSEVALFEEAGAGDDAPSAAEIRDALGELPPNQRAALVLRELGGLSYDEIARQLDVTVGSVQMLLFRARRTLREESSALSRRASSFFPPWLLQAVGGPERFVVPARAAAGLALAVGLAASVPSSSAGPVAGASAAAPERRVAATFAADVAAGPIVRPLERRAAQSSPTGRGERRTAVVPQTLSATPRAHAVDLVVSLPKPHPGLPRVSLPEATAALPPAGTAALPPLPPVPLPPLPLEVPSLP